MIISSYGHATPFSALTAGDCYFYDLGGKNTFAIAIKAAGNANLIGFIFDESDPKSPRIAAGGHPYVVFRLEDIEIRPDLTSLHFNPPGVGELTSAAGQFYVIGLFNKIERYTANLSNGVAEVRPEDAPFACFSRWTAGRCIDGKWNPIFQFPMSTVASS